MNQLGIKCVSGALQMTKQPFPQTSGSLSVEDKNTAALLFSVQVINLNLFVRVELLALEFEDLFPSF